MGTFFFVFGSFLSLSPFYISFSSDITFPYPTEDPERTEESIKLEHELAHRLHSHEQTCRAEYGENWTSPYLHTIRDWHWDAVEEAQKAAREVSLQRSSSTSAYSVHTLRRKVACLHQEIDFFQPSSRLRTPSGNTNIPEIYLLDALARGTAVITGAS